MNLDQLQRKLIAAARATPPDDCVPYAFEKRILARLNEEPVMDFGALWARALWRAATPCVAVVVLLGAWAWFFPHSSSASGDLSQDLESTLLAAVDQDANNTW